MSQKVHMDLLPLLSSTTKLFEVQKTLSDAGFVAWLAGGCVRDAILGRDASDFDVVTNASVEDVKKIFPRTVLVGEQFGVLKVLHGDEEFEIAQFRRESDYKDGRRPSLVESATPEEDAQRRDLTVNALFYDPQTRLVHDFVGGLEDLQKGLLRAVGKAEVRFQEDHLRILRAVRFKSQLGFEWEKSLERAILNEASLLRKVSRERVRDELQKMTKGRSWPSLPPFLVESGILRHLFEDLKWDASNWMKLEFQDPESIWWEWGLWALRAGNEVSRVVEQLSSLRLSRSEVRSLSHFLFWFENPSGWARESPGALLERCFEPGAREGLLTWFKLHPSTFAQEAKLRKLIETTPVAPEAWVRAQDLPHLKGPALGQALKEAYRLQLGGEASDRAALLARFASRSSS